MITRKIIEEKDGLPQSYDFAAFYFCLCYNVMEHEQHADLSLTPIREASPDCLEASVWNESRENIGTTYI